MAPSFAGMPAHERQAFFSLLDEYFESRPHLLPSAGAASASHSRATNAASKPTTRADVSGTQAGMSALSVGKSQQSAAAAAASASRGHSGQAEVLFDFRGAEADDLSVKRYDIIDLVERVSDDWWRAKTTDGSNRTGIVPSNYIKVI